MSLSLILFAALAPLLWSVVNHFDKYLLSKYFKGGGVGGLMIFSTFFSIFLLPIILYFDQNAFTLPVSGALVLMLAGACNAVAIYLYLIALNEDEASIIVPFFQLIPVFTFLAGYLVLGETLTTLQIIGGGIILLGVSLISFYREAGEKLQFKWKIALLMISASLLFSVYTILFKFVSLGEGFWSGVFWEAVGLIATGFIFCLVPGYWAQFVDVFKSNSKAVLSINVLSEILTILGNWITAYATLLAPAVLVALIAGYQPLFVFMIGIGLTLLLPRLTEENISKKALFQKGAAIVLVVIGTSLLY